MPDFDGMGVLTSIPSSRLLTALRLHKRLGLPILLSGDRFVRTPATKRKLPAGCCCPWGFLPIK